MRLELFRSALIRLLRRPGYLLGLSATLSLGLALTITMYAVVHGVALAPLPYPDDEQIVVVQSERPRSGAEGGLTPREALETVPALPEVQSFAYYQWGGADLLQGDHPQVLTINTVGGGFFDVFALAPLLGRTLGADDIGKPRAVLSHAAWVQYLGADPTIVGQTLKLNWISPEIVGVMPPSFDYPSREVAMWIAADESVLRTLDGGAYESSRFLYALARLRADTQPAQFNARLAALAPADRGADDWMLQSNRLLDEAVGARRPLLWALLTLAALVLLIGCANAAHLIMVRAQDQQAQYALMRALGASQARVAAGFYAEVAIISVLSLGLALLLVSAGLHTFVGLIDSGLPRADQITLSPPVLRFAVYATAVVALICSLWPAHRLRQGNIAAELKRRIGSSALGWSGRLLPILAIALSLAALSTAALLALSAQRLANQDALVQVDRMLALQLFPGRDTTAEVADFLERARQELSTLPGVEQVALMSGAPFTPVGSLRLDVAPPGTTATRTMQARAVSGPVFAALGVPLLAGRLLNEDDRAGTAPVLVLNQRAAELLFAEEDPIGRRVSVPPFGAGGESREYTVVGVVADRKMDALGAPRARPEIWLPFAQYPVPFGSLLLTSALPPKSLMQAAQAAVWRVDPGQGIYRVHAPADDRNALLAEPRFFARNAGAFAVFALVLSVIGVYGVLAVDLGRRRRELALRAALGASTRQVIAFVAAKGLAIGVPGVALGLLLALAAAAALQAQLFGIGALSPWIAALSALPVLLLTASICLALSRRALRVQPHVALREE